MKKALKIVLALMLIGVLVFSVHAAGELGVTLNAPATQLHPGDQVVVTVSVSEFANCKSGSIRITYDSAMFSRSNNAWLMDGLTMNEPNGDAVFACSEAQTLSGDIYRFTLTVKTDAAFKASDITVKLSLKNQNGTTVETKNLQITVSCDHSYSDWKEKDDDTHTRSCSKCQDVQTEKHQWEGKVTKVNGCDQAGEMTYTCKTCGAKKTEVIEPSDHVWDSGKVTKKPTCAETGTRTYTCASCGTTKTEEIAKTNDHNYGEWKKTDSETHARECSVCHYKDSGDHDWNDGEVTKKATCAAAGERKYTCIDCGATRREAVDKLTTHTFDSDCDDTCNVCGEYRVPHHKYGESWSSDSSGHWHECSACGDRREEGDHTPGAAATEFSPQVCTTCGYVIKNALGHTHDYAGSYTYDQRGHWYACSGCEEKKNYAEHFFFTNCDSTCAVCGYEREVEHDYSERLTYDATGHWNACTVCGDILERKPHNPGPEATETTDQICLDCGYIISPANSHEHTANGDLLANESSHWHQCACGEKINWDLHGWSEGVKDTVQGTLTYTCTVCGYTRVELLPEGPQPTDPVGPTEPEETDPQQPVGPDQPGQNVQGGQSGSNTDNNQSGGIAWWWYVIIGVCVLLLGAVIFVIIGILFSRKQVGKYSSK